MDKFTIKANLALLLKDSYTGSENLKGAVSVRTHNGITAIPKITNGLPEYLSAYFSWHLNSFRALFLASPHTII